MDGQTIVKKEEFNEINWPRVSIFNVKVVDPWPKGLKRNFFRFFFEISQTMDDRTKRMRGRVKLM